MLFFIYLQTQILIVSLKIIINMKSLYSEDNEQLQTLWKDYNKNNDDYLEEVIVIEWIKTVLEKTNALENFQSSLTDLPGLIKTYLQEVHQVSSEQLGNIKLSYPESVDFLRWLTTDQEKDQNLQQENQMPQHKQQPQLQEENLEHSASLNNKQRKDEPLQQQEVNQSPKSIKKSMVKSQKKLGIHPIQHSKLKTQQIDQKQSLEEGNEITQSSPNQLNIQQLSKKYKGYLKIIFEHYCKISYATGQDPTFQQIKHKTTIMTINKFMILCKDFQIPKISEAFNRSYLIQIFKKNSECYKEMSFEQFCQVIKKIANLAYSNSKQGQQKKDKSQGLTLNEEMFKILQFFQIQNARKFKQKMKKLNIQYRIGPKTKAELKVIPDGYRFKYTSNNGKSEDQIKLELQERKQHRSERKIMLQQRVNNPNNEPSFRKRVKSKNNTYIYEKEEKIMKEVNRQTNNIQFNHAVNKILTPPVPPPKKLSYLPPNPPKASNHTPSVSSQPQAISNSNVNIFKKDLSYAQIHKIKQNEGYSRKLGVNKSSSKEGNGNFKLNSIVEQARLQVQQMPQNHGEIYSDNLTESIGTNSREESVRAKNYDLNKINNKIQIINERNRRDREIKEQLESLIDMSNDDDEFLKQHLERQKKNDTMGKRLSQRINQLQRLK